MDIRMSVVIPAAYESNQFNRTRRRWPPNHIKSG